MWKNYKGHLFQQWGGWQPPLLALPCRRHCSRAERPMHTILNYNQVFYFTRRKYQLRLCVVYKFTCAGCNSVYNGETTLMFQFWCSAIAIPFINNFRHFRRFAIMFFINNTSVLSSAGYHFVSVTVAWKQKGLSLTFYLVSRYIRAIVELNCIRFATWEQHDV